MFYILGYARFTLGNERLQESHEIKEMSPLESTTDIKDIIDYYNKLNNRGDLDNKN